MVSPQRSHPFAPVHCNSEAIAESRLRLEVEVMVSPPPPPTSQTWHPAMMLPITVAGLAFGTPSAAGSLHWHVPPPSARSVLLLLHHPTL